MHCLEKINLPASYLLNTTPPLPAQKSNPALCRGVFFRHHCLFDWTSHSCMYPSQKRETGREVGVVQTKYSKTHRRINSPDVDRQTHRLRTQILRSYLTARIRKPEESCIANDLQKRRNVNIGTMSKPSMFMPRSLSEVGIYWQNICQGFHFQHFRPSLAYYSH